MESKRKTQKQRFTINKDTVNSVLVENELNLNYLNLVYDENFWHKFIIHNVDAYSVGVDDILKSIIKLVSPYELIACDVNIVYDRHHRHIVFICNSCGPAIELLCKNKKFTFYYSNSLLDISIVLCYYHVNNYKRDVKKEIFNLIFCNNRYDPDTCTLDLSYFNSIKEIKHLIYCIFKNTNSFIFILSLFKDYEINSLDLSGNNIESIDDTFVSHTTTKYINNINLKNNKINNLDDIKQLMLMDINEITLTDNPICGCYENASDYLFAVKSLIPSLQILDGIQVDTILTALPRIPCYVTSKSAEYLIVQFLEHYFTVYDNMLTRRNLINLYHSQAIFSMSSLIVAFDIESEYGLQKFDNLSHNLLKWNKSDFDIGPECIVKKLCYLPNVKHDPQSFCIDVLNYTEGGSIVFVINGSFKEPNKEHIFYNFTRMFVLVPGTHGAYYISNDMLYVTNAEPNSIRETFNQNFGDDLKISLKSASSDYEKAQFVESFTELTSMQEHYSEQYLKSCDWNFREALEKFVCIMQFNLIPTSYFNSRFNNDPVEVLKKGPLNICSLKKYELQKVINYFNINMKNRYDFCPLKPKWCSNQKWIRIRYELLKRAKFHKLPLL